MNTTVRMYSTVPTGPNTQLGGVNEGFAILEYHQAKPPVVTASERTKPADRLMTRATTSRTMLLTPRFAPSCLSCLAESYPTIRA